MLDAGLGPNVGCGLSIVHYATYLVHPECRFTSHLQYIECAIVPGSGQVIVTGAGSKLMENGCRNAMAFLMSQGQNLQGKDNLGLKLHHDLRPSQCYDVHFNFGLDERKRDEIHVWPTLYLAVIAAATGRTMDPSVRRLTLLAGAIIR